MNLYRYKVWYREGRCHLWTYESFKEEANGTVVDFSTTKNIINYIIYEVDNIIPQKIFDDYDMEYCLV